MADKEKKGPVVPALKNTARKSFATPFNTSYLDKLPQTVLLPEHLQNVIRKESRELKRAKEGYRIPRVFVKSSDSNSSETRRNCGVSDLCEFRKFDSNYVDCESSRIKNAPEKRHSREPDSLVSQSQRRKEPKSSGSGKSRHRNEERSKKRKSSFREEDSKRNKASKKSIINSENEKHKHEKSKIRISSKQQDKGITCNNKEKSSASKEKNKGKERRKDDSWKGLNKVIDVDLAYSQMNRNIHCQSDNNAKIRLNSTAGDKENKTVNSIPDIQNPPEKKKASDEESLKNDNSKILQTINKLNKYPDATEKSKLQTDFTTAKSNYPDFLGKKRKGKDSKGQDSKERKSSEKISLSDSREKHKRKSSESGNDILSDKYTERKKHKSNSSFSEKKKLSETNSKDWINKKTIGPDNNQQQRDLCVLIKRIDDVQNVNKTSESVSKSLICNRKKDIGNSKKSVFKTKHMMNEDEVDNKQARCSNSKSAKQTKTAVSTDIKLPVSSKSEKIKNLSQKSGNEDSKFVTGDNKKNSLAERCKTKELVQSIDKCVLKNASSIKLKSDSSYKKTSSLKSSFSKNLSAAGTDLNNAMSIKMDKKPSKISTSNTPKTHPSKVETSLSSKSVKKYPLLCKAQNQGIHSSKESPSTVEPNPPVKQSLSVPIDVEISNQKFSSTSTSVSPSSKSTETSNKSPLKGASNSPIKDSDESHSVPSQVLSNIEKLMDKSFSEVFVKPGIIAPTMPLFIGYTRVSDVDNSNGSLNPLSKLQSGRKHPIDLGSMESDRTSLSTKTSICPPQTEVDKDNCEVLVFPGKSHLDKDSNLEKSSQSSRESFTHKNSKSNVEAQNEDNYLTDNVCCTKPGKAQQTNHRNQKLTTVDCENTPISKLSRSTDVIQNPNVSTKSSDKQFVSEVHECTKDIYDEAQNVTTASNDEENLDKDTVDFNTANGIQETLVQSKTEVNTAQGTMVQGKPEVNTAQEDVAIGKPEVNTAQEDMVIGKPEVNTAQETMVQSKPEVNTAQEDVVIGKPEVTTVQETLVQSKPEVNTVQETVVQGNTEVNTVQETVVQGNTKANTVQETVVQGNTKANTVQETVVQGNTEVNTVQETVVQGNTKANTVQETVVQGNTKANTVQETVVHGNTKANTVQETVVQGNTKANTVQETVVQGNTKANTVQETVVQGNTEVNTAEAQDIPACETTGVNTENDVHDDTEIDITQKTLVTNSTEMKLAQATQVEVNMAQKYLVDSNSGVNMSAQASDSTESSCMTQKMSIKDNTDFKLAQDTLLEDLTEVNIILGDKTSEADLEQVTIATDITENCLSPNALKLCNTKADIGLVADEGDKTETNATPENSHVSIPESNGTSDKTDHSNSKGNHNQDSMDEGKTVNGFEDNANNFSSEVEFIQGRKVVRLLDNTSDENTCNVDTECSAGISNEIDLNGKSLSDDNIELAPIQEIVVEIHSEVDGTKSSINDGNSEADAAQGCINDGNSGVDGAQGCINNGSFKVDAAQDCINDGNSEVDGAEDCINECNSEVDVAQGCINDGNSGVDVAKGCINDGNSEVDVAQGCINDGNSGVDVAQGCINDGNSEVDVAQGCINDGNSEVDVAKGCINDGNSEVGVAQGCINNDNSEVNVTRSCVNAEIDVAQSCIDDCNSDVNVVEDSLHTTVIDVILTSIHQDENIDVVTNGNNVNDIEDRQISVDKGYDYEVGLSQIFIGDCLKTVDIKKEILDNTNTHGLENGPVLEQHHGYSDEPLVHIKTEPSDCDLDSLAGDQDTTGSLTGTISEGESELDNDITSIQELYKSHSSTSLSQQKSNITDKTDKFQISNNTLANQEANVFPIHRTEALAELATFSKKFSKDFKEVLKKETKSKPKKKSSRQPLMTSIRCKETFLATRSCNDVHSPNQSPPITALYGPTGQHRDSEYQLQTHPTSSCFAPNLRADTNMSSRRNLPPCMFTSSSNSPHPNSAIQNTTVTAPSSVNHRRKSLPSGPIQQQLSGFQTNNPAIQVPSIQPVSCDKSNNEGRLRHFSAGFHNSANHSLMNPVENTVQQFRNLENNHKANSGNYMQIVGGTMNNRLTFGHNVSSNNMNLHNLERNQLLEKNAEVNLFWQGDKRHLDRNISLHRDLQMGRNYSQQLWPSNPNQSQHMDPKLNRTSHMGPQLNRPSQNPHMDPQLNRPSQNPNLDPQLNRPSQNPHMDPQLNRSSQNPHLDPQLNRSSQNPHMDPQLNRSSQNPHMDPQLNRSYQNPHLDPQLNRSSQNPHMDPQLNRSSQNPHMDPQLNRTSKNPHLDPQLNRSSQNSHLTRSLSARLDHQERIISPPETHMDRSPQLERNNPLSGQPEKTASSQSPQNSNLTDQRALNLQEMNPIELLALSQRCHSRVLKQLLEEKNKQAEQISQLKLSLIGEIQGRAELQSTVTSLQSEMEKLKTFISLTQQRKTS